VIEDATWTLALAEAKAPARAHRRAAAGRGAGAARHPPHIDPGTGGPVEAAIYDRAALKPGARIEGPAVIAEAETSTLVPKGFRAGPNAAGHILIERIAQ